MDIGEEEEPIELPLPVIPEALPEHQEPERSLPLKEPEPEKVPS